MTRDRPIPLENTDSRVAVVITEAMIDAGSAVADYLELEGVSTPFVVAEVYRAMRVLAPKRRPKSS